MPCKKIIWYLSITKKVIICMIDEKNFMIDRQLEKFYIINNQVMFSNTLKIAYFGIYIINKSYSIINLNLKGIIIYKIKTINF